MPSVTVWNRLEPSPRSDAVSDGLSARVRDPLWMLARQWQFGEFLGEDAGSPAFVDVAGRLEVLGAGAAAGPLERSCHDEGRAPDLALRVELGQTFEAFLAEEGHAGSVGQFRTAFPLTAPPHPVDPADREATELLLVCAGRVVDGVDLLARAGGPEVPGDLAAALPALAVPEVRRAVNRLADWARQVHGAVSETDGGSWRPDLLRAQLRLPGTTAGTGAGAALDVLVSPTGQGELDWFSCDLVPAAGRSVSAVPQRAAGTTPATDPGAVRTPFRIGVLPARVSFPGMPGARFWGFEDSTADLAELVPDERDTAKLLVVDFVMLQSHDWFVVPVEQPLGTTCHVDTVIVRDVFGESTVIEPAVTDSPDGRSRWAMFVPAAPAGGVGGRPSLTLPGTAGGSALSGPPIEEVRFARDATAQLAWGIEEVTAGAAGSGIRGEERSRPRDAAAVNDAGPTVQPGTYRIQSDVPGHWIPLVPVADPASPGRWLERATLLTDPAGPGQERAPVEPLGRILRPTTVGTGPYRIHDEQVPAAGLRVCRIVHRARWIDGSTHLWTARVRRYGGAQPTDPLRFDRVEGPPS